MVIKVLILGDSFISRFKSFLRDSDHKFSYALNLDTQQFMIQYCGIPGANVSTLRQRKTLEIVSDFEPEVVVLHIGSNDVCSKLKSEEEIAGSVVALVELLVGEYEVKTVIAFQILQDESVL